ncbi:hypothetical protein ABT56_18950 [Photobacterium aquae]|uniref:Uncharacterized protein n=1 Tax=Photobacterium aquae TaxID=1195763 RepID=A0A0J1GUV4_9GAMM|nr:hypothetical protein ABT56_18950 [Photobacterium aquae]
MENARINKRVNWILSKRSEAFRLRVTPDSCPYNEGDWRYDEWMFGWDSSEQAEPDLFDHVTGKFKIKESAKL